MYAYALRFEGIFSVRVMLGRHIPRASGRLGGGEIGGLKISNPPTQAEVQALRDACEELADDVRALAVLLHALQGR